MHIFLQAIWEAMTVAGLFFLIFLLPIAISEKAVTR